MTTVQPDDLPSVFQIADKRADRYQRSYRLLMFFQIWLPVVAAVLSFFGKWASVLTNTGAATSGLAVFVAVVIFATRPDKRWHRNRAVAEFVKSHAWRYMVDVEPYSSDQTATAAEHALQRAVAAQIQRWSETKDLSATVRSTSQTSATMQKLRGAPLPERIEFYVKHRLKEQLDWYTDNSTHSSMIRDVAYAVMLVGQLIVMPVALFYAVHTVSVSVLGVLTSLPAAVTGFLRIRRHEDLAPSYAVAAQRLKELLPQADTVVTETEFRFYVARVEDLLTTEHAEWLIRRS